MDLGDIRAAAERVAPYVKRTPLERSTALSSLLGTNVYVKYELFQKIGAFKARGAFNKLLLLDQSSRSRGVVAVSGGNHAQAVSYAASVLGIDAVIVMPDTTPATYVNATRGYGATVDLTPSIAHAFDRVREYEEEGRISIHPFDDPDVMAGQGTVGLEIYEDLPEASDVVVSIGGGGLAGGVSTAIKALSPETRVWGVETEGAEAMSLAFVAGHPVETSITSIAKTLGAPYVSAQTLELAQRNLDSITVVSDADAVEALLLIAERLKVIVEPAASCTWAAAKKLREHFTPESKVVLILCGGNVSIRDICGYLSQFDL